MERLADLSDEEYAIEKERLCIQSVNALKKIIPDIKEKIDHLEAATPRTIKHYTHHASGASGTKFEGLEVSSQLPENVWSLSCRFCGNHYVRLVRTINYIITANKIDRFLRRK